MTALGELGASQVSKIRWVGMQRGLHTCMYEGNEHVSWTKGIYTCMGGIKEGRKERWMNT